MNIKRLWLCCALALTGVVLAADVKISALPSASALAGTEAIPTVQGGATVQTTPAALKTYVLGSAAANQVIATPNGSSGAPSIRALVAGDLPAGVTPVLSGTTGSIGGSALLAGACAAGTATVTGATSSMAVAASPSADPDSTLTTGIALYAFVSATNTVTVRICAIVAVTPTAVTYNVRVLQ